MIREVSIETHYMDSKLFSLVDQIDDIRLKLTDAEYKNMLETVSAIRSEIQSSNIRLGVIGDQTNMASGLLEPNRIRFLRINASRRVGESRTGARSVGGAIGVRGEIGITGAIGVTGAPG